MKKSILVFALAAWVCGAAFTSCKSPSEKVEAAKDNVVDANKDLDQANREYLADMDHYRKETASKITANEQNLAEFKARIAHEKKDAKKDYKNRIDELEQKNSDMKMKMDNYKDEGKEKWEAFKAEFTHDMDELGKSFKDLTDKKVK